MEPVRCWTRGRVERGSAILAEELILIIYGIFLVQSASLNGSTGAALIVVIARWKIFPGESFSDAQDMILHQPTVETMSHL